MTVLKIRCVFFICTAVIGFSCAKKLPVSFGTWLHDTIVEKVGKLPLVRLANSPSDTWMRYRSAQFAVDIKETDSFPEISKYFHGTDPKISVQLAPRFKHIQEIEGAEYPGYCTISSDSASKDLKCSVIISDRTNYPEFVDKYKNYAKRKERKPAIMVEKSVEIELENGEKRQVAMAIDNVRLPLGRMILDKATSILKPSKKVAEQPLS